MSTKRWRKALAAVALALVLGCAVFLFTSHAHRRPHDRASPVNPGGLAAEIQANIAEQQLQATERLSQVNRHETPSPDDEPPLSQMQAIKQVERVAHRFLAGYLSYETGRLSRDARADITSTATRGLALSLLGNVPRVPPPQQQAPPPRGRLVGMRTALSAGRHQAQVYVEVAYGLENGGFTLIFVKRGEGRWQVVAFHG